MLPGQNEIRGIGTTGSHYPGNLGSSPWCAEVRDTEEPGKACPQKVVVESGTHWKERVSEELWWR